jgi:alanine racemase
MFSKFFLYKQTLINNVRSLKREAHGRLCVMVKANAYGHGLKEIVNILKDEVDFFGVSNQAEGEIVRALTSRQVIVFGACDDYEKCIQNDISFAVFSFEQIKDVINISKKINKPAKMHLCLNTGMNRYGVKSAKEFSKIVKYLKQHKQVLEGLYTHFSSLTCDEKYTQKQKTLLNKLLMFLPKEWHTIIHVGGGLTIKQKIEADMHRVGLEAYGYGNDSVKPILKIESEIVDINKVEKGEHVGYMCSFTAKKRMMVATIPLGYGDGLPRKLSNKTEFVLNGQKVRSVGNICMDALMIDVSGIKCKIGDKVEIMKDASVFAKILDTSEYEVLTNFSKFRGDRIII